MVVYCQMIGLENTCTGNIVWIEWVRCMKKKKKEVMSLRKIRKGDIREITGRKENR